MLDILIVNGQYPNFESNTFVKGDVGIKGGKIVSLGMTGERAMKVIDAKGKIVSPGFIDIHMHEENFLEEGARYCIALMMLRMGVTTCLGGNCGISNQPVDIFRETVEILGGAPVNYRLLTGYNTLRRAMGIDRYEPSTKEQQRVLREQLNEEVNRGTCGISFGLEYDPGISFEEVLYVLEIFAGRSDLLVSAHYRSDSTTSIDSILEMIRIADLTGLKFQISHLSSCSAMGQMEEALSIINKAIGRNPRLNYDTYPYNAFSTHIGSTVFDDGWMESWGKGYDSILLTGEPYKGRFCTKELFEKARKDYPEMLAVAFVMNEEEIARAIANPHGMVASDGIISNGNGHPRAAGTFPRLLGKYVREDGAISLLDALRKITKEPAERLDLKDKGKIRFGFDADITIFDPDTIIDGATFEDISIPPRGIGYVILGGNVAVENGEVLGDRYGVFF